MEENNPMKKIILDCDIEDEYSDEPFPVFFPLKGFP